MLTGLQAHADDLLEFNGRLILENSEARIDGESFDESEIRQLRLQSRLNLSDNLFFRTDWELSSGSPDFTGGFIDWRKGDLRLRFGQSKLFTGLNVAGSQLVETFGNRPAIVELTDALTRQIGVTARYRIGKLRLQGGVYHKALADDGVDDATVLLSRIVWVSENPADESILHLGLSYRYRNRTNDASSFIYRARPESRALQRTIESQLTSTRDNLISGEFLWQKGPFTFNGEIVSLDASDSHSIGAYGDISWFIGGRKGYRSGPAAISLGAVDKGVFEGGLGAIEFAVRFDYAELNETALDIQRHFAQELAVVWHLQSNIRLQLVGAHAVAGIVDQQQTIYSLNTRLQASF